MLIPKGCGDFQRIGIVEVMCKTVVVVLNCCLGVAIDLHNILHGFRSGSGMETASLEAKLLQKLTAVR